MPKDYDENLEDENSPENLVEDGEISPEEAGFMQGYHEDDKALSCAYCKKIILDPEDSIKKEIDGEIYLFCSDSCYEHFKKEKEEDIF
jgi:YHS domain-containing protein